MFTPTAIRVSRFDTPQIRERIKRTTEQSIAYYSAHPQEITIRLAELDKEWDMERALETASSSISLFGIAMGVFKDKRWLMIPFAVQAFFLQHSVEGWCPPLPVLRRMGFRTQGEIDKERYALKAIRGDFHDLDADTDPADCLSNRASRAVED